MCKVSIGMPIYNAESYVAEAFDSLISQTFDDFEIIISDNCSKDRSSEICDRYAKRDPRIRYYRQTRTIPPAENHNFVLDKSVSPFFKWATYDDVCHPEFLARCVRALEADKDAVLAYSKAVIIDDQSVHVEDYTYRLETGSASAVERFRAILRADHRKYACFEIYGVIRLAALRSLPAMGNYVSADRLLLARLALMGKFIEVSEPLFFSREHRARSVRTVPSGISAARKRWRRIVGVGALPPLEWWDPSKKGRINFPEWRALAEYGRSISNSRLSPRDRLHSYSALAGSISYSAPKLIRDLLLAGEQALGKLSTPLRHKTGST